MKSSSLLKLNPLYVIIAGTFFTGLATTLMIPYLTIYLTKHTELSLASIGWIVGAGPLAAVIGGLFGGALSDIYGRKNVMLYALLLNMVCSFCFLYTKNFYLLAVLTFLCGMARMAFNPAAMSMLMLLVNKDNQVKILSYDHTAYNVGSVAGMFLGALFINFSMSYIFIISAVILGFFAFLVLVSMEEPEQIEHLGERKVSSIVNTLAKDKVLSWMCVGGIFFNFAFSQIMTSLPIHMERMWGTQGVQLYSVLILINTIMVISLQIVFAKYLTKKKAHSLLIAACSFLICGFLFFEWLAIPSVYIAAIVLITLGELFSFVGVQVNLTQLSASDNKGSYFGAWSIRFLGDFVGPSVGLYSLQHFSSHILFSICALAPAISILCYLASYKKSFLTQEQECKA